MANKKTVVENYDAIKAMLNGETVEGYTLEQALAFLDKRIEITQKKNAGGKGGELTPKQREKMEQTEGHKTAIVSAMAENTQYTPSDLVKLVGIEEIRNTQKITPMLTALVEEKRLVKATVKGRSVYALPSAEGESEE
jgi:hypothetical protein